MSVKRIAFFTVGFAFNRQARMRFYEKIFPAKTQMYLITTNKYATRKSNIPQQDYALSRTKIVKLNYDKRIIFQIRNFCIKNKIDCLINLGFHTSAPILFLSTLFTKTNFCINVLTDIFKQHYLTNTFYEKIRDFLTLPLLFIVSKFAKKMYFTDPINAMRAPAFFLSSPKKMIFLAAPVDTKMFYPKDKKIARNKLKLNLKEKIILYVGRVNYLRCGDILKDLIIRNKSWKFIIIGPLMDKKFNISKNKNVLQIEKMDNKELINYYAAADFVFCLNRGGGGIGLSSEEALSCGKPIMISKQFKAKECPGIYQINIKYSEAQSCIKEYFNLPKLARNNIAIRLRNYANKYYSYIFWKSKYNEAYLDYKL